MTGTLTGKYIVHLISCLLTGKKPDGKPDEVTFEDIYRMSVFHGVSVMTLRALEQGGYFPDDELKREWDIKREHLLAQNMVQVHERDRIYRELEKRSVPYIPLKGCLLKDYYPEETDREMVDLDILIQKEHRDTVHTMLLQDGYVCDRYGRGADDVYSKPPYLHIEMHHQLMTDYVFTRFKADAAEDDFFLDPWKRALHQEGYRYGFSDDDLYLYMLVHLAKHYYGSGAGIRQFADLYVMSHRLKINRDYVFGELERYRLGEFGIQTEQLLSVWFEGAEPTEDTAAAEQWIFSSGSFGTSRHRVSRKIDSMAGGNAGESALLQDYLLYRVFPPYSYMTRLYPSLKKHRYLLPAYWGYRILFRFPKRKRRLIREARQAEELARKSSRKHP